MHYFEKFIYKKYPELKKIKEKEKEENKLDLEKEENEVASTIDMIIE